MKTQIKSYKLLLLLSVAMTVLASSVALAAAPWNAGGFSTPRKILYIDVSFNTNAVYVTFDGNLNGTNLNPCASSTRNLLAFDATSAKGKVYLSMVTAAFLAGRSVRASGTAACNALEPNIEGMAWFKMM